MLSDEEKQAIKYIKNILNYEKLYYHDGIETNFLRPVDKENVKTVLNLIEKQSKEIEELKEQCKEVVCIPEGSCFMIEPKDVDKKWEDKIKAKIEEWDKDIKWNNADDHYYAIKMMQSLLEKG